jgi:hypothetical protein
MSDERAERAAQRRQRMTFERLAHGSVERAASVSGRDGMALAAELSRLAWVLSGRPLAPREPTVRFVPRT